MSMNHRGPVPGSQCGLRRKLVTHEETTSVKREQGPEVEEKTPNGLYGVPRGKMTSMVTVVPP